MTEAEQRATVAGDPSQSLAIHRNSEIARERDRIIAEARRWIDTPYHNGADIRGAGVDCGMLIVRVFVDTGLCAPFDPRPYPPDWHLHRGDERYLGFVFDRCAEVDDAGARRCRRLPLWPLLQPWRHRYRKADSSPSFTRSGRRKSSWKKTFHATSSSPIRAGSASSAIGESRRISNSRLLAAPSTKAPPVAGDPSQQRDRKGAS